MRKAYAGDIVGLYDPGLFRIGDTLSTGKPLCYDSVPRFSPEHFARLLLVDPMKRKQLHKGITQLAEEGTVQLFTQRGREKDPILGVVGRLQFDVLSFRLEHEYGAKVKLEPLGYSYARWVQGVESISELEATRLPSPVIDSDGLPVVLLRDDWELKHVMSNNTQWEFSETAPFRVQQE